MMLVYLEGSKFCFKKWCWFSYNETSSVLKKDAGLLILKEVLFQEMMLVYLEGSKFCFKKWCWFTYNEAFCFKKWCRFTYNAASSVLKYDAGLLTMQQVLIWEVMLVYLQYSKFCFKKWCWFTYNAASSVLRNHAGLLTMKQVQF